MIRIRPSAPEDAAKGYVRRTALIESAAGIDDIWFMTPADVHPLMDDWLLPVGAVIGMVLGEDVHIAGRVSENLLASMDEIQRISVLRNQPEGLQRVRITAEEAGPTPKPDRARVVSCFSGGVDAFYTALDPDLAVDEHLFVHGMEARVEDERMLACALPHIRAASQELGRPLRLAETNWRSVIEPLAGHNLFASRPLFFAIAHLVGSDLSRFVMPETHDETFPPDHPSSIATYLALWGTSELETVEHGHVTRFEKVRRLIDSDVAMRHLRVCWERTHPTYNCGRCEKCMRTRIHLLLADAEGRCETLPPLLGMEEVRRAPSVSPAHRYYLEEGIAEAESRGMPDLAAALRSQRERLEVAPNRRRDRSTRKESWWRRFRLSWRKRRFDLSLRRLKRRCGHDHLFNCLGAAQIPRSPGD